MSIIAERQTASGAKLQQRICGSCKHAFWTGANFPKSQCADCDPEIPDPELRPSIGRNFDRKRSDSQYHGGGYNG